MKRLALIAAPLAAALVAAAPAPAHASTLGEDAFSRSVSSGWGTTSTGSPWSILKGPSTAFRVDGAEGIVSTPAGYQNTRETHAPSPSVRDVDATAKLTLSSVSGTNAWASSSLILRRQADGRYFRVGLLADAAGNLRLVGQTHAFENFVRDGYPGIKFAPGTTYNLRVQLQGGYPTVMRSRLWKVGTTEPTTWHQQTKTDRGPQTAGSVGVRTLSVNTSSPVTTRVDDLRVTSAALPRAIMSQWRQVFADEFNGTGLNTTAWSAFYGSGHQGNGLRRPGQVRVQDGNLVITAEMLNGVLHSGGISHRSGYKYGRFEFRVRTDRDPSSSTSGVVLTWPQAGGWPINGENDIYETGTDADRTPFYSFIHFGATNQQLFAKHSIDGSQWQEMAMEWDANSIKIFRGSEMVWSTSDTNAIPDVLHRGGIQLDAARATMGAPVSMYVDYFRIYQKVA